MIKTLWKKEVRGGERKGDGERAGEGEGGGKEGKK